MTNKRVAQEENSSFKHFEIEGKFRMYDFVIEEIND